MQEQPRRLDRVAADRDRVGSLELLAPLGDVADAGAAPARVVDLDAHDHRLRPHLDAVLDRVGEVRDQRARLRVHLAALEAEAAVDAVRAVPELAVRDRHRSDAHLDPVLPRSLPGKRRRARDRMRPVRVGVRVAPRPVLPGHGQLALEPLEGGLQVPVGDRPVGADPVARADLEVGGMEARRVAGEVRHRPADADPRVVLAHLDRVVSPDDARVRPVDRGRGLLVGDPVAVRVPERPLLQDHDPPPRARKPLRQRDPAGARAHDDEVDGVLPAVAPHPVEVPEAALVRVEEPRRVVLLRHREGALAEERPEAH